MKRSDFLAIISIFPFIRKKPVMSVPWKFNHPPARLQAFEKAVFTNIEEQNAKFLKKLEIKFPGTFEIKGSDLIAVINKKR